MLLSATYLEMQMPLIMARIFDEGLSQQNLDLVWQLILISIGVAALKGVCSFCQWYFNELNGQMIGVDLRRSLHDKLQILPPSWFVKEQTGVLMSKLTGDVDNLQTFIGWGLLELVTSLVRITGVGILLFTLSPSLTIKILIVIPFLVIILILFDKKVRPAWEAVREQMGKVTTNIQENISGVRVIKSFAQEHSEVLKFEHINQDYRQKNLDRIRLEASYDPLLESLSALAAVFFVFFGGQEVIDGTMQFGQLVAYSQSLSMLIWPARMLGWLVNLLERALAAAPRVFQILDATETIVDSPEAIELTDCQGHLKFEHVYFRYADSDNYVLEDINLDIRPGERIAIVGGTGSGKSTLVNLIPRFNDCSEGRITLDGNDLRDLKLSSLRRQIGQVLQETFLFSTSIGDNIAFGDPRADQGKVTLAAQISQAAEFIEAMPHNYHTLVGERGLGLSGGQKQRIALARAILMDPAILILDEATASVDTETEWKIQEALDRIMHGRTSIIIAKRLSTIKGADRIIILDNGRIAEQGTPQELHAKGGLYRRLFENQFAIEKKSSLPQGGGSDGQH